MFDGSAEERDEADGGEFFFEGGGDFGEFMAFGEDEPEAVILGGFEAVAEHEDDFVADVDGVAAEHVPDFGVERVEGFEDEGVGRGFAFGFCGEWVGDFGVARHGGRIAEFWVVEHL